MFYPLLATVRDYFPQALDTVNDNSPIPPLVTVDYGQSSLLP